MSISPYLSHFSSSDNKSEEWLWQSSENRKYVWQVPKGFFNLFIFVLHALVVLPACVSVLDLPELELQTVVCAMWVRELNSDPLEEQP